MNLRVGIGYDVHRLEEGLPFLLGGVKIPHTKGALGHSDADVLIHAVCDALLGAANMGDIGRHFPDTSAEFKGIDSKILLAKTYELLLSKNFSIVNIDTVVMLEKPKIRDYVNSMQETMADVLQISPDKISVKATTTEGMSFIGKEKGVAAQAVVLISRD
ncbi:MAG: 2-C-methyl-D-erythritol 2,4-cyclodiphosphate synthase [Bacteroidales bacterium]|nr:2-C-methyl-D-erythritol 2,4-cyclodiphosphate synthase [Bacteroidales bacterium]MCB8999373.1 2-C-methyl-D-erythritol 2,4-cyclodiphosphate synthase [Bacteroidales bacterium]MCB9013384.1 2-C-methyl-D-erythritol 2,4-cyclodiphosphate synthase [Bacteroidales bacterium]